MRNAVNGLSASYAGYSAVFAGNDTDGYQFIIGSEKTDCTQAAALLREKLHAKCGGSPVMIQGSVKACREQIAGLLLSLPAIL